MFKRIVTYRILSVILAMLYLSLNNSFAVEIATDSVDVYLTEQVKTITTICNQQPDSALLKATFALQLAKENGKQGIKAELQRLIGLIWFYKVDYAKSLDYFSKSHDLFVQLNDKNGEADALNNISLIYRTQGFLEEALEMDQKVLEMRKRLNNPEKLASGYNNMAVAYLDLKNYDSALLNYQKAISISIENEQLESLDLFYNNVGNLYFEIDLLDSAYYYFQKSLSLSIPLNHKQMISNSHIYLGQYFLKIHDYENAKYQLKTGLKLAQEIGIVYEIEDAAKYLHEAYSKNHEDKNAYETHKLYKEMADSAKNLETIQKITKIESELKFKRERELDQIKQTNRELADQLEINKQKQARNIAIFIGVILLLIAVFIYRSYKSKSEDNMQLQLQKDEIIKQKEEILFQRNHIEELNTSKDKFFAMIAHDLRNPLGGIYKLSDVVYTNLDYLSKEKLEKYMLNIKTTTESVYSLLDNLLKWASFQSGSLKVNSAEFNLAELIQENIDLLSGLSSEKNLSVRFNNDQQCLGYADQEMINTVVRNLMTNAIKFTPTDGKISINLSRESNFWNVCISDTGIGISDHDQKLLFTLMPKSQTLSHSKYKGIGLGLVLCKEFTIRNGGQIWVESQPDKGSSFSFTVPSSKT